VLDECHEVATDAVGRVLGKARRGLALAAQIHRQPACRRAHITPRATHAATAHAVVHTTADDVVAVAPPLGAERTLGLAVVGDAVPFVGDRDRLLVVVGACQAVTGACVGRNSVLGAPVGPNVGDEDSATGEYTCDTAKSAAAKYRCDAVPLNRTYSTSSSPADALATPAAQPAERSLK